MTPEQQQKLNEIHTAIIGKPELGQPGIIPRLEKLEKYQEKDRAFKQKAAGGIAVGSGVFVLVVEWIKGKLKGDY